MFPKHHKILFIFLISALSKLVISTALSQDIESTNSHSVDNLLDNSGSLPTPNNAPSNVPANGKLMPQQNALQPNIPPIPNNQAPVSLPNQAPTQVETPQLPQTQTTTQPGYPFAILEWIGYHFSQDEKIVRVDLDLNGRPVYEMLPRINQFKQNELVVRLFRTELRKKIRRDMNAQEFYSPVSYIRTERAVSGKYLDVVLTLRGNLTPKITRKDTFLSLIFDIPENFRISKVVAPTAVLPEQKTVKAQPLEQTVQPKMVTAPQVIELKDTSVNLAPAPLAIPVATPAPTPVAPVQPQQLPPVVKQLPASQPNVPYIPMAPQPLPMQPYPAPQQQMVPQPQENAVPLEDESHPAGQTDEKFEVLTHFRVGAVAQDQFLPNSAPSNVPNNLPSNLPNNLSGTGAGAATGNIPPTVDDIEGQSPLQADNNHSKRKALRLDFRGTPLSEVVRAISSESHINFIIPPDVSMVKTTVTLTDVPWDLALKAVLETNGLGMVEVGPNLIRIDSVKRFSDEKKQLEDARKSGDKLVPTKILVMRLSYGKAKTVVEMVTQFLKKSKGDDERFQASADERTNSLVVEATPNVLAKVKALVERIDLQTPQVRISSRILEVSKTFKDSLGVSWGTPFNFDQGRGLGFGNLPFPNNMNSAFAVDPNLEAKTGTADFRFGSINNSVALDLKIRAEETRGNTEVLQNQSVIVQDNEESTISAGLEDVFQIQGTQTTAGSLVTYKYDLVLKVTPRITADGAVQMKVAIDSKTPEKSQASSAAAGSSTRSVATSLIRRTGETAVIGGLYATQKGESMTGIPFLMDLPIIGSLFRRKDKNETQRELLIMVTPSILNSSNSFSESPSGKVAVNKSITTTSENIAPPSNNLGNNATLGNNANVSQIGKNQTSNTQQNSNNANAINSSNNIINNGNQEGN